MIRETIKRVLREQASSKVVNFLTYKGLSENDKDKIKINGESVFTQLKGINEEELNKYLKDYNLYYGEPSKDYLIKNITDIDFALKNIDLEDSVFLKLTKQKVIIIDQLNNNDKNNNDKNNDDKSTEEKSKNIKFFQEIPTENNEKSGWSIVNMFNTNIKFWIDLINDFLMKVNIKNKLTNIDIINLYFNYKENNKKYRRALYDLLDAMINRSVFEKKIINKTWGGGQKVEQDFILELKSIGFSDDQIYVFSGEKNVVDQEGGIDLAIKCKNLWIPIQVKSNLTDALRKIPYNGFSSYPSKNRFELVSEKYENCSSDEICEKIN
jgi:hypothetical protein